MAASVDMIRQGAVRGRNSRRRIRRAGAVLELALALPMVLYLAFGIVEFGQFMYIKHAFEAAARDATRVAIMANATQTQVTSTLTTTLSEANVTYNSAWLTITDLGPSSSGSVTNVANVPVGDQIQLILSANYASIPNAVRPLYQLSGVGIGSGKSVVGECTMVKE
ncbi:MAG: TadE family protein [Tepidisphaeraceae bacterium]